MIPPRRQWRYFYRCVARLVQAVWSVSEVVRPMSSPRVYRCIRCGRFGSRGFWHSTDPGHGGYHCMNATACAQRRAERDERERQVRKQWGSPS